MASKPFKKSRGAILGIFFLCLPLLGSGKIEIVTNGIPCIDHIQSILDKHGQSHEVVECDLNRYWGLKKGGSFWKRLSEKIPYSVPVDRQTKKLLFMNIPQGKDRRYALEKLPKDKLVLFMWEPPIRSGKMYSPRIQQAFGRIFTWDDDLVDNKTYFKLYYPEKKPMRESILAFQEKKFCTMVVGATNDKSKSYPNELYSHRIRAIRFFESIGADFQFYGRNWDAAQYPSYRGPVDDKIGTLSQYKFSICYENCYGLNGYVTEKIFDCFAAATVPIYWGAQNITSYIPKGCFIDRRDFATLEDLHTFLSSIDEDQYNQYLANIRAFLSSPQSDLFSPAQFEKTILRSCL